MNRPALSVIIPVWNGERYLGEAIESVLAQEAAPPMELIVVDDGSEDGSTAVAERFGPTVRCARIAHSGLAAARNAGLVLARGEYLLHLDADDVLPPRSIAARMAEFDATDPPDLVVGQMVSFISRELDTESAARFRLPAGPQRGGLPGASVVCARFAGRVGDFDTSRSGSPDLDWMMRAESLNPHVVEVSDVVLRRRIHGRNMSLRSDHSDRLASLRAALHRRRADDG